MKKGILISLFSLMLLGCSNQTVSSTKNANSSVQANRERLLELAEKRNKEKQELEKLKSLSDKEVYEELVKINKELSMKNIDSSEKAKLEMKLKYLQR